MSTGYRKCTYLSPLCSRYHLRSVCLLCLLSVSLSPYYLTQFVLSQPFLFLLSQPFHFLYLLHLPSHLPFNTPFRTCTNLFLTVALLCFCLSAIHLLSSIPKFLPQIAFLSVVHLNVLILPMCLPLSFPTGFSLLIFSLIPLCNSSVFFLWDYEGGFILGGVQYEVNFCHIDRRDKIKHTKMVLFYFSLSIPL